jgi:acetyl esterase/lipase
MRTKLWRGWHATRHVGGLVARRLRHGPTRPSWPLSYEVAVGFIRWRFSLEGTFDDARRGLDEVPAPGALRGVQTRALTIGGVACVEHTPASSSSSSSSAGERVIVYLHGGGYCTGSPRSHRPVLGGLTRATGARVIAVDYRRAPEHPCPAAIDDALAVMRALLDDGVPPGRLWLAGDSAGGGLLFTTLVAARDAGLPAIAGAVPLSPWTDLTGGQPSHHAHVLDYLPAPDRLVTYARAYAGNLSLTDPQVSPLFADLRGLPPLLVFVGGAERLHDDGVLIAARAKDAGVDVTLHVEPDEIHVWPMFHPWSPRAADAFAKIAAFVDSTAR